MPALELSKDREVEYGTAFTLALSRDSSQARELADDLERRFPEDTSVRFSYLPALHARPSLNRGDASGALEMLQAAVPYELGPARSTLGALYPVYLRGEAYLAAHQGAEAATEFQKDSRSPRNRGQRSHRRAGALATGQSVRLVGR